MYLSLNAFKIRSTSIWRSKARASRLRTLSSSASEGVVEVVGFDTGFEDEAAEDITWTTPNGRFEVVVVSGVTWILIVSVYTV